MGIGSYLKTHRKSLITHTMILGGFLLFLLFLAEPLFDVLERIPGEAQLHQLPLPAETMDIKYAIDDLSTDGHVAVKIRGWAFIKGTDANNSRVYIVMKANDRTYIFDTIEVIRPDVTRAFKRLNLDLDYSGFLAIIPARKISSGKYTVGLYIKKDSIQALYYTHRVVVKSKGAVKVTFITSTLHDVALPMESENIKFAIDSLKQTVTEEKEFIEIRGWAFIKGQSAENSQIYIVLKSDSVTYVFDTILQKRPDVTAAYVKSGLNLDNSGFFARIAVDSVEEGPYKVGIYIKKGDIKALNYTQELVEF